MDIYEPTYNGPSWWGALLPLLAFLAIAIALGAIGFFLGGGDKPETPEQEARRRAAVDKRFEEIHGTGSDT